MTTYTNTNRNDLFLVTPHEVKKLGKLLQHSELISFTDQKGSNVMHFQQFYPQEHSWWYKECIKMPQDAMFIIEHGYLLEYTATTL